MSMMDLVGRMARAAATGPAGEAASPEFVAQGWSSLENKAAFFTVYRAGVNRLALTAEDVDDLLTVPREFVEQPTGWLRAGVDDRPDLFERIMRAIAFANREWFRHDLVEAEALSLARYLPGVGFAPHVDRHPVFGPDRVLNCVAMLQTAKAGGQLRFNLGGKPIDLDLSPGDVVVFDAGLLHEVVPVRRGVRQTLITHALRRPL